MLGTSHRQLSIEERELFHLIGQRLDRVGQMVALIWGVHEFLLLKKLVDLEDLKHWFRREVKVVVVTMHEDETYARQALLAGATGYVLKKAVADELIDAIRAAHRGQRHIAACLAQALSPSNRSRR